MSLFCNQCGHRNPDTSNFCSSCGAVLEQPGDAEPTTITLVPVESAGEVADDEVSVNLGEMPADSGLLVVKRGSNVGSRFALGAGETTVGRHPQSDIFLDDVTVSRRHAEIRRANGSYAVHDVGSLNGTYVNRERIEDGILHHGDELQIGKFRLVFFFESAAG
jgi:pSer/pThr/pTyr-binding forkhead associated (FHA) protein